MKHDYRIGWLVLGLMALHPGVLAQWRDKSAGEEWQIEQRRRWFLETRNLEQTKNANQRRNRALAFQRSQLASTRESATRESAAMAQWQSLGPSPMNMLSWSMGQVSGRVSALVQSPTQPQLLYLGTASGGVWKSTDGGQKWEDCFAQVGTQTIGSLCLSPHGEKRIWVGTGEHGQGCYSYFGTGLYLSEDGGVHWSPRNGQGPNLLTLSHITGVVERRGQPGHVLAGGERFCREDGTAQAGGVFLSMDEGANWTKVFSGTVFELLADAENDLVFWLGSDQGVFRSSDGGEHWVSASEGINFSSLSRLRLAQAPSDPDVFYALCTENGATTLYRSADHGATWVLANANACEGQCSYNQAIAVSPANPNHLLVGSIRFAFSSDGGHSLQYLTQTWGGLQAVHQDTHVLRYHPSDPQVFYVGSDGGLWRTDDSGASFVNLNLGLNITQFYDIAVHPEDHRIVFGGAQDNSSSGTDDSSIWDVTLVTGDGFMTVIDPLNPEGVIQFSYPYGGLPSYARSFSGGGPNSFSWVYPDGLTSGEYWPWVTRMTSASNPAGTATHFFIASGRLYLSNDFAENWSPLAGEIQVNYYINAIEPYVAQNRLGVMIAGILGELRRCDDVLSHTPVWISLDGHGFEGDRCSDLAMDPKKIGRFFATVGSFQSTQLYRTEDFGEQWAPVGSGLPQVPANAVSVDPLLEGRVFVGTDIGVYVSLDDGDHFVPFVEGMPLGTVVQDLEIDDDPYYLTAGTYGRGAFQQSLFLPLSLEVTGERMGCLGEGLALNASPEGGTGAYQGTWKVLSGPSLDPGQWSSTLGLQTVFTAGEAGVFEVEVTLEDASGSEVTRALELIVGSEGWMWENQVAFWPQRTALPLVYAGWDRNQNGAIDVLDLLMQRSSPQCY